MLRVEVSDNWNNFLSFNTLTGRINYHNNPSIQLDQKTDFWVVRHGETIANQKKMLQGSDHENEHTVLSTAGEDQVKKTAEAMIRKFRDIESQYDEIVVVSSPAQRACQTAQVFLKKIRNFSPLKCQYSEHAFLHEIRFGEISGMTEEEIYKLGPEYIKFAKLFRYHGDSLVRLNGGESFHDLLLRVREGFLNWQSSVDDQTKDIRCLVIAFTHMITASALRVLLEDKSLVVEDEDGDTYVNWRKIIQNAQCLVWNQKKECMQSL